MSPTGLRVGLAGLCLLALAGCSGAPPYGSGLAAKSDEFTITQQLVADEIAKVQAATGAPTGEPPAGLALANVQRIVQDQLVASEAQARGVEVTQTQIEQGLAGLAASRGGMPALEQAALAAGLPVDALDEVVRTQLLIEGLGRALAPNGDETVQAQEARKALTARSDQLGVQVAPRYGVWDHETLAIVGDDSVVRPAPIPEPDLS